MGVHDCMSSFMQQKSCQPFLLSFMLFFPTVTKKVPGTLYSEQNELFGTEISVLMGRSVSYSDIVDVKNALCNL